MVKAQKAKPKKLGSSKTASATTKPPRSDNPMDWLYDNPLGSFPDFTFGILKQSYQGHRNKASEFAIRKLRAPGVAELVGEALPFLVPTGSIDLGGTYALDVGDRLALDVKLPTITATGVALRARDEDEDWVAIPSIVVTN